MMERTTGVRALLSDPRIYELFQRAVGADHERRKVVADHLRPRDGERILDIGCGPGTLLPHLGDVVYTGVDLSEAYIEQARGAFGSRATFIVGDATALDPKLGPFDAMIMIGVQHHIDDPGVEGMLMTAAGMLAPQGRLIAVEPALLPEQRRAARFVITRDRGQHVRTPEEYARLARPAFANVEHRVRRDLLRIPYDHCVLECRP